MLPNLPGRRRRLILGSAIAVAIWAVLAFLAGPGLVRAGYHERSLSVINAAFGGRTDHTLEFYLTAWWSLVTTSSVALLGILALVAVWTLQFAQRRLLMDRLVGGSPALKIRTAGAVMLLAAGAGGFGEALAAWLRLRLTGQIAADFQVERLWMAPLSAELAALPLVIGVGLLALGSQRRTIGLQKIAMVAGFLAVHPVVQSPGFLPLHKGAEVMISLGVASVFARSMAGNAGRARFILDRSGVSLATSTLALVGLAWWSLPSTAADRTIRFAPDAEGDFPNILLIILDAARAADFSLYGYERETSPELDDWARSGTTFNLAVSSSSWTLPSHAALFTGEHNHTLGTGQKQPLAGSFTTLAEALSAQGYETAGFAANPSYTTTASGLGQGFALYEDRALDIGHFGFSSWLSATVYGPFLTVLDVEADPMHADEVTDRFLRWADGRDRSRPFFAFLNYFDTHDPYDSPPEWTEKFGPRPSRSWRAEMQAFRPREGDPWSPEAIRPWVDKYDAAIAYVDHHLGILRRWLATSGEAGNTLVIIASDHGEMFGEQGQLGHASSLHLPVVHVPLVIILPGRVPEDQRVDRPVSLVDIPRTVADLVGAPYEVAFPGESLFKGQTNGSAAGRYVLAELVRGGPGNTSPWWAPLGRGNLRSLFWGRFQYIRSQDGTEELFDLAGDPDLETNLIGAPEKADVLRQFRAALDSIVKNRARESGGPWGDPDGV